MVMLTHRQEIIHGSNHAVNHVYIYISAPTKLVFVARYHDIKLLIGTKLFVSYPAVDIINEILGIDDWIKL